MGMDDSGAGRGYRRHRWVSPIHSILGLQERFDLPESFTAMKDIDLGDWLDDQVEKAIRHGYFENLESGGPFRLVKFFVADDPIYAVVCLCKEEHRQTANKRFKESIATVLTNEMVQHRRQHVWKKPPSNPFGALADLPHAPSATSLVETQPVEPKCTCIEGADPRLPCVVHDALGNETFEHHPPVVNYEPILITYGDVDPASPC